MILPFIYQDRKSLEIKTSDSQSPSFNNFAYTLARYSEEGKDLGGVDIDWDDWIKILKVKLEDKKNE